LRYRLKDEQIPFPDTISSFLLESLTWNVPNEIFIKNETWTGIMKESINYLYNKTRSQAECKEWGEVSEQLYLFHAGRKWTCEDVNNYMKLLWTYLEF
jgi:hypothetical protein